MLIGHSTHTSRRVKDALFFFFFFFIEGMLSSDFRNMKLQILKADKVPQTLTFHTVLSWNNFLWPSTAFNHSQNSTSYNKNKNKGQKLQTNLASKWKLSQWPSKHNNKRKEKAIEHNLPLNCYLNPIEHNLSMHLNIHKT